MGAHLIDKKFQSDKYPSCPRGKVPLSTKDPAAQDLLWTYAQRRRAVDAEFAQDLEDALVEDGFQIVFMLRATRPATEGRPSYFHPGRHATIEEARRYVEREIEMGTRSTFEIVRVPR